jgi:hypothetical protein
MPSGRFTRQSEDRLNRVHNGWQPLFTVFPSQVSPPRIERDRISAAADGIVALNCRPAASPARTSLRTNFTGARRAGRFRAQQSHPPFFDCSRTRRAAGR